MTTKPKVITYPVRFKKRDYGQLKRAARSAGEPMSIFVRRAVEERIARLSQAGAAS